MYKLVCNVQKYGWGRHGHQSKVAVYKKAQDNKFEINDGEAYAELWMGTHVNCPSKIEKSNELIMLSDYLKSNSEKALGQKITTHFYNGEQLSHGDLPFLFKVLSINQALSIQAHPNKALAKQLHSNDPKNYPDSNHKPEMLIAISPSFEAMCGFRPADEIAKHFSIIEELVSLCEKPNVDEFVRLATSNDKEKLEQSLRKCFSSMMNKNQEFISEQFVKLKRNLLTNKSQSVSPYLDDLFLRLADQYPNDVGCFSIYLLNCLKLNLGEAIFLSANIPHAYLFGDGVECMACSDNVVRAGLTPKFKDVKILCDMLDYTMRSSEENKLKSIRTSLSLDKDYLAEFRPTVNEFSVQQIKIEKRHLANAAENKFLIPKCESGSILIVIEVDTTLGASFSDNNDTVKKLDAKVGLVYYIDSSTDIYFNVPESNTLNASENEQLILLAYRAYCDIKSN